MPDRPSWDETWFEVVRAFERRSTCARRAVAAVIVSADNRFLGEGYNGVAAGLPHCAEEMHFRCPRWDAPPKVDGCEAVHAEANALVRCISLDRAWTIYVTSAPCVPCMKLLLSTPIVRVAFREDPGIYEAARDLWLRSRRDRRWDHVGG